MEEVDPERDNVYPMAGTPYVYLIMVLLARRKPYWAHVATWWAASQPVPGIGT